MRVLLLSRYSRSGNTSRVRSYQYIPLLAEDGIEVMAAPFSGEDYLRDLYTGRRNWAAIFRSYLTRARVLLDCGKFDLVWLEREMLPMAPALAEALLDRAGIPYVVDYDDAVFHNYDQNPRPLVRGLLGRKIATVMRHARMVLVGNPYLAQYATRAGARRIEQLPSVVDLERYTAAPKTNDGVFTIGWIGIPPNTRYLVPIEWTLRDVCRRGRVRIVLVGSGEFELEGVPTEIRPWSEGREADDLRDFDVGIMPLPDTPWERGKCGYKLLQYFACGRPAVASPVGVNSGIVEDGINGFLASTPEEWARALDRLREDPDMGVRMGAAGRRKVEQHYSLARKAPVLAGFLRQAAGMN